MKKSLTPLFLVAFLTASGAWMALPQAASAQCGYACNIVSADPPCRRCEDGGGSGGGGCVQFSACGCYEVQCMIEPEPAPETAILAQIGLGSDVLQASSQDICLADLPAATVAQTD